MTTQDFIASLLDMSQDLFQSQSSTTMNDINRNYINTYVRDLEEHNETLQRCVTDIADIATRCLDVLDALTKADVARQEILKRAAGPDNTNALSIMEELFKDVLDTPASAEYDKPAPSPVVEPHNPDNLTGEQVGVGQGWRLLDKDEIKDEDGAREITHEIELWDEVNWNSTGWVGALRNRTYRTKLSREALASLP